MTSYRNRSVVIIAMIAASMSAFATNPPPPSGADADASSIAAAGASSNAVGVGLGIGLGVGQGGDASSVSIADGGDGFGFADSDSSSAVLGSGNSSNLLGQGQEQDASAVSDQAQDQGQDQAQDQTASSDQSQSAKSAQGQSMKYTDSSKYLSLSLPGATADPGTTAACTESRRGWTFAGFGASGRTRINAGCASDARADAMDQREFVQCLEIADRLAVMGALQASINQLGRCGGGIVDTTVAVSEIRQLKTTTTVTKQTTDYVTKDQLDRAFSASQAK